MLRKMMIFGLGICMGFSLMADYESDFKAALDLFGKGKNQEA